MEIDRKVAVIGIVVIDREQAAEKINEILSAYGSIIIGRMGIPYHDRNISVISIIVDGTTDQIGALTGKIGNVKGVKVKVAVTY